MMPGGLVWTVPRPPVLRHRTTRTLDRDKRLGREREVAVYPLSPKVVLLGPRVTGNLSRVVLLSSVSDLSLCRNSELARVRGIHSAPYLFLSLPLL